LAMAGLSRAYSTLHGLFDWQKGEPGVALSQHRKVD